MMYNAKSAKRFFGKKPEQKTVARRWATAPGTHIFQNIGAKDEFR